MADYAVLQGLPAESVVLDEHSFSTWQNIENALRLIGTGPVIIASDTFHARRARRYMWQQAPGVGRRLRRGCDYRLGELFWLKPILAVTPA